MHNGPKRKTGRHKERHKKKRQEKRGSEAIKRRPSDWGG